MPYLPARAVATLRLLFATLLLAPLAAQAQAEPDGDNSQSPYFSVHSDDPANDRLPLKSTQVRARVLGVIADVTVTQHYRNEGSRPLEAQYVFPASTRAAVYAMQVRIGERQLNASIREKQQAKQEYEAGKLAGKTSALLEQHRENVFQMNVANILPGDEVAVELHYTELLVPTDGVYRFVFPTVVGPRYNGALATGSGTAEPWIATPYQCTAATTDAVGAAAIDESAPVFDLQVQLATPTPVRELVSPSHAIDIDKGADNQSRVRLAAATTIANDRDFILDYRLAGDRIESGLLLSKGSEENFFLALVAPPKAAPSQLIVPREYLFVVDISGSMHGFPLDTAKVLLQRLLAGLRPSDRFNVMLFSGSSSLLAPDSQPANADNIARALTLLDTEMGSGGTELLPALRQALAVPGDQERARSFVVITDGFVTVERDAFELVRKHLDQANLFAFGIGSSVNRQLIEGLARAGQGEPFVVLDKASAAEQAERFRRMIDAPLLTHVQARFEGLDTYEVEPPALPDLFAQRPLVLFGKWRGEAKGRLLIEGQQAGGAYRVELPIRADQAQAENQALALLWARHRVASLTDQETLEGDFAYSQAILDLGLKYHLLTPYTSFVAVDEVVRTAPGTSPAATPQPLPLPQGVSPLAVSPLTVGAAVPSTPEPSTWAMLLIAALGGLLLHRRGPRGAGGTV
ncbi:MAG: VIT domain-containing protein [Pseudomonas sp.]|uniref:VIT domain-containing protein n=1 Tax=Pseudomonas sp. TaxID=306 RepID=UPI00339521E2